MTLQVLRPGALSTLQDLGRFGYQRLGISAGGAMDEWSHRLANILVGNEESEATLELTLFGPTLRVDDSCLIAICGADLSATVDEQPVPMRRPILLKAGSRLEFGKRVAGARAYLAVQGGYAAESVMNSKSTFLRGGFGGFNGRALKSGDSIETRTTEYTAGSWLDGDSSFTIMTGPEIPPLVIESPQAVRVVEGQQWQAFCQEARNNFLEAEFRITPQSDRMGYRIEGKSLKLEKPLEMISEAVTFGTIQVPADGNPIILMSDRPTTGGYPKVAHVARVDLPLLAQMFAPSAIRFTIITVDEAQELYLEREQEAKRLKRAVAQSRDGTIDFRPVDSVPEPIAPQAVAIDASDVLV